MHFRNFKTHTFVAKEVNGKRTVEGIVSAEIVDKDTEITLQNYLISALKGMMKTTKAMSLSHSNRIVGQWEGFEPVTIVDKEGTEVEAIYGKGFIHKGAELYDQVWRDVQNGELRGFSFGGATKSARVPITTSNGKLAYQLKDLEVYEVAICKSPSVPWALITNYNKLAKSVDTDALMGFDTTPRNDGNIVVQCEGSTCFVNQSADKAGKGLDSDSGVIYRRAKSGNRMVSKADEKEGKNDSEEEEDEKDENDEEGRDEDNSESSKDKAILTGFDRIIQRLDKSDKRAMRLAKELARMNKRLEVAEKKTIPGFKMPNNNYVDTPKPTEKPSGDDTADSPSEFDIATQKESLKEKQKADTLETPNYEPSTFNPTEVLMNTSSNPIIEYSKKMAPTDENRAAILQAVKEDHFGFMQMNPMHDPIKEMYY